MREEAASYVFDEDSVKNPFGKEDVSFYAKAYYLLGTLACAGKSPDGSCPSKAIAYLRMADRLGYDGEGVSPEDLIARMAGETDKGEIRETTDCHVEVRDENKKGERYLVVLHHADGTESIVNFKGRNKFLYILALLIAHEGRSVYGLTTAHFSYMREYLSSLASDSHIGVDSYSEWIDEFIYAVRPEADIQDKDHEHEKYCSLYPYRYSNAFSGANRAVKASCVSDAEYEVFKLRSTGGKKAIITMAIDARQIVLPHSLENYLDCLPTQKELACHKTGNGKWVPVRE